MTATGDQSVPREERVLLAVRAYQQGQFGSTRKAAAAYDVPQSTVSDRLRGVIRRRDAQMNNLKLTATEETALRGKDPVGENWVRKFVGRHGEIKAKYSRRYDYQRAKCEDPQKIQGWYDRVAATKQKWGILDEDVYNFDETGFQMGVASTARPGNREWVTVIESINCQGWALPAKVIFQGKLHQASWYESGVPDDWHIAVSENGWTSDDLALNCHVTPEFDKYCTANSIVLIKGCQMAMHSTALLADENRQLRSENQRRKQRKEQRREYIGDGGTLSVAEGTARIKRRREEEEERVKRRRVEEEERTKRRREKDEERAKRRQEEEERAERRRQENEEWFKLRREKEEERVKKQRAKEDERAKRQREEEEGPTTDRRGAKCPKTACTTTV
ncbi:helix-turn-helix, psq domain-containing protein [Hirsutella rhossiliensis]